MTIVIDTSVLIDHLRGNEASRDALRSAAVAGERLTASVLTRVEVLAGMRTTEEATTRRLLDSLDWVEVDDGLAERAGDLANRYVRSHPGIDPVDYVIAATVQRLDARLWTRNVRHFPMFPGLASPY
jgi:hypothetical protein